MYKATSATMQRLALGSEGSSHRRLPRPSGPITHDEQQEFGIPGLVRDEFLDDLAPAIRDLRRSGHLSTKALAIALNAAGCRTALGRRWNPRLTGFLLGFLSRRRKREAEAREPARSPQRPSPTPSKVPLTKEEIARRLSALGRVATRRLSDE